MSTTILPSPLSISAEVDARACQLGVRAELPQVVAMTQSLFPGDAIRIELDDDPEDPADRQLAVVVRSTVPSIEQLVEAQWEWHQRLFHCCPALLTAAFRLTTESEA